MSKEPPPAPPPPGKRSGSEKRARDKTVKFRATAAEKQRFNEIADSRRQSIGDLLRTTLLGIAPAPARRSRRVVQKDLARLLGLYGNIASNINQYTKRRNMGRETDALDGAMEAALRELVEYRSLLMQALGFEHPRAVHEEDEEPE